MAFQKVRPSEARQCRTYAPNFYIIISYQWLKKFLSDTYLVLYPKKINKNRFACSTNHVTYTRNINIIQEKHYPLTKIKNQNTSLTPNKELAKLTGCSLTALNQIVKKGEGAYFSSGSRPNQTAQSWGLARLASSITAGKSAAVDYDILNKGCDHNKKAFKLANKSRKKYKYGHSKTRKTTI